MYFCADRALCGSRPPQAVTEPPTMNQPTAPLSDEAFSSEMRRALRDLPDAPPALLRAAIGLWTATQPSTAADVARAALRLVQAVLTFDSWSAAAVAPGMRSLRSPTRHLLFSAEGRDVDLRITPAADAFAMNGQILGPDDTGVIELINLDAGDASAQTASLDAMGEFRLDGLAAGHYVLTLNLGADRIVLPPVQLGAAAAAGLPGGGAAGDGAR
jgi:hypothetical protein